MTKPAVRRRFAVFCTLVLSCSPPLLSTAAAVPLPSTNDTQLLEIPPGDRDAPADALAFDIGPALVDACQVMADAPRESKAAKAPVAHVTVAKATPPNALPDVTNRVAEHSWQWIVQAAVRAYDVVRGPESDRGAQLLSAATYGLSSLAKPAFAQWTKFESTDDVRPSTQLAVQQPVQAAEKPIHVAIPSLGHPDPSLAHGDLAALFDVEYDDSPPNSHWLGRGPDWLSSRRFLNQEVAASPAPRPLWSAFRKISLRAVTDIQQSAATSAVSLRVAGTALLRISDTLESVASVPRRLR